MTRRPDSVERLLAALTRLPGFGPKAAERILFHLLKRPKDEVRTLAQLIHDLPEIFVRCVRCGNYDTRTPCVICADRRRDQTLLCVVAEVPDIRAIEKTGEFRGVYHVLHGLLNPIEGVTPDRLNLASLVKRVGGDREPIREIVLALNPNVEGEATALYLRKALRPFAVRVTKLARGLPLGAELEYADEMTLGDAIRGRREMT